MTTHLRRPLLALCTLAILSPASRTTVLFTTASDFAGWATSTSTPATPSTTFDTDGLSTNGVANPSAGSPSTPGSLQIDPPIASVSDNAFSPDLSTNFLFMSAIDPGFTPGFTADYAGTLSVTYTTPATAADTPFGFALNLAYDGDNYYENFLPTLTSDPILIDGLVTRTARFDYTIHAAPLNSFRFRVVYNSASPITSPFFLDSIQTPEPSSLLATCGLALLRRRK